LKGINGARLTHNHTRYYLCPSRLFHPHLPLAYSLALPPLSRPLSARLTHPLHPLPLTLAHCITRQYHYVLQSLTLWREVTHDMFKLWILAEDDLLESGNNYRLKYAFPLPLFLLLFPLPIFLPLFLFLLFLSLLPFPSSFPFFLSLLSFSFFPFPSFLFLLSFSFFPFPSLLSLLSFPFFPFPSFLSLLSFPFFPFPSFLSLLFPPFFPLFLFILVCNLAF
jgi:hypothetical protein